MVPLPGPPGLWQHIVEKGVHAIRSIYLLSLVPLAMMPIPAAASGIPHLLPRPAEITARQGSVTIGAETPIRVPEGDAGARQAAERFAELIRRTLGFNLTIEGEGRGTAIRFLRAEGGAPESYTLASGEGGVTLAATDDVGLLWAGVTLWQLMTPGTGEADAAERAVTLPALSIEDAPRFAWRGLMLDSARHFQSPEYVRSLIDWMAANKLNRLHWHLVDDQGWRLEIERYPELTGVSGWRLPATTQGAPALPRTGGFYTQQEVREIVAYAAARGITIVPEIEMPGHALAAIRAFPELGTGVPVPPGTESDWGVFPWLYNVEEPTFSFLENVLDEVLALFPSPYIHVGGDEAVKDQWKASPAVQAKMAELGIGSEEALQGWFVARIGAYLEERGRRLIGWDEILEGGVPGNAVVMSWRGIDGAIEAAEAGRDTVLSPAPTLYLDNRQGTGPAEPPGRGNLITLRTVYDFDPVPDTIPPEDRHHVLGLQANLWTEHIRTEERAQWMTFPRASAVAEIGWSPAGTRDYADFVDRLVPQMERMRSLGLKPATSVFAVTSQVTYDPESGMARVTLEQQADLPIRYTTDGSAPDAHSSLYYAPLSLDIPAHLRAVAFRGDESLPGALDLPLTARSVRTRSDRELKSCGAGVFLALEDDAPTQGPRADFLVDIMNPCWIYEDAPLVDARRIAVTVGQVPFNFQIGDAIEEIVFAAPQSPAGEMIVRAGCNGPRVATLPLAPALDNPGLTRLEGPIAPTAQGEDLCITYSASSVEPLWAVDAVELIP